MSFQPKTTPPPDAFNLREAFMRAGGAQNCPLESIDCPALGGAVTIRGLTAAERDEFEASLQVGSGRKKQTSLSNFRAKLLVQTIVNRDSLQQVFTETDVDLVGSMPATILEPLFNAAARLCGFSAEDVESIVGKGDAAS